MDSKPPGLGTAENGQVNEKSQDFNEPQFKTAHEEKMAKMADMSCRKRPRWDNKYEFWVSIISATVGFGNVWRFPFIAFQNGGGAFLIPYVIVLVLIGSPLYFLETSVGQFSNRNCVNVWEMSPAMKVQNNVQRIPSMNVLLDEPVNMSPNTKPPLWVHTELGSYRIQDSKPPGLGTAENGQVNEKSQDFNEPQFKTAHEEKMAKMADMSCRKRPRWDNKYEFWVSIISATVGFGNVWRFPFIAFQNGGGAFLIPYVIVLVLIGSPLYFLETSVGQFSNRNCVNVWEMSPAMKGTGYAQTLGAAYNLTYNVSLIALCLYYIAMSFSNPLPWSVCDPEWTDCIPSGTSVNMSEVEGDLVSSAEYFFRRTVLRQSDGIHDGIGTPLWDLSLCLLAGWIIIFVVVSRGIKSSGKAAWFFALFPYVGLTVLLIRAVTLPGAGDGILFLITPQWHRMLEFSVWYQAATQVFFSLSVSSGILIMYSSYNNYNNNVYKVSLLVSYLDSVTSLVAAIIIFAVLGNLAHELNYDDIRKVIKGGGTSLAFISYPDAIAKSPFAPQLFAVLFFVMLVSLGLGCGVAMMSTVNTMLLDKFPQMPVTLMSAGICVCGFSVGLVYMTPGGQYILEIVDFYGGPFMRVFTSIPETIGFCWIYGIENICLDIEFMLKRKTSFYWRVCWAVVTPISMFVIFTYVMVTSDRIKFGGTYEYPWEAYFAGEMLRYIGISLVPLFMIIALWKNRSTNVIQMIKDSFRKAPTYGPLEKKDFHEWKEFRQSAKVQRAGQRRNWLHHIGMVLFKGYKTD